MNVRYDKLYMGNDVFFYNDKSGRVERLHATMEGSSYNRSAPIILSLCQSSCLIVHPVVILLVSSSSPMFKVHMMTDFGL